MCVCVCIYGKSDTRKFKVNPDRAFSASSNISAEQFVVFPVLILQSLKLHVLKLSKNIDNLKLQLVSSHHVFFFFMPVFLDSLVFSISHVS